MKLIGYFVLFLLMIKERKKEMVKKKLKNEKNKKKIFCLVVLQGYDLECESE